jgi:hypothetical protein
MPVLILVPGSHEHLTSRKRIMCSRNMGAHVRHSIQSMKGIKKWDKKLESHATKKGVKKLVSSNVAKILKKESSNKY